MIRLMIDALGHALAEYRHQGNGKPFLRLAICRPRKRDVASAGIREASEGKRARVDCIYHRRSGIREKPDAWKN